MTLPPKLLPHLSLTKKRSIPWTPSDQRLNQWAVAVGGAWLHVGVIIHCKQIGSFGMSNASSIHHPVTQMRVRHCHSKWLQQKAKNLRRNLTAIGTDSRTWDKFLRLSSSFSTLYTWRDLLRCLVKLISFSSERVRYLCGR